MDQAIVLFLHRDIGRLPSSSSPLSILEGIIEHTLRRNKTIHSNRITALQFILSGKAEFRKRINRCGSLSEPALHRSVRYINADKCKGQCKNPYQVVSSPIDGGNRP